MRLKARLAKLEKIRGEVSNKYYVLVFGNKGESEEEAVARTLKEMGIQQEDVGHMFVAGEDFCFEKDFGGYCNLRDLRGWVKGREYLRTLIASVSGSSVGPPSCRKH
jgi:hypothetical protein